MSHFKKTNKKPMITIIASIVFIVLAVLFATNFNTIKDILTPTIDANAVDWEGRKDTEETSSSGGIAIPGYKSISLKANQLDQSVSFENPEQNNCYFVISLYLPDGTNIYRSDMVQPGKGLYNITLKQEIEAGTYENSFLAYECYRMDDTLTQLNGANVKLTLDVK